jgi:hypothetical protein
MYTHVSKCKNDKKEKKASAWAQVQRHDLYEKKNQNENKFGS